METRSRAVTRAVDGWGAERARATLWEPPAGPTLFVVPHPDDEVLIMGGLLARQLDAAVPITIVAVTDGEAAYPDLVPHAGANDVGPDDAGPDDDSGTSGHGPPTLAAIRRREQGTALAHLAGPRPTPEIIRLGLPDGRVERFERQLADSLGAITADLAPALIVAPWAHDHHCDHEAVGRAAALVAAERSTTLAAGLFWAWSRTPPTAVGLRRLPLPDHHRHRRRAAIAAHRSQLTPPAGASDAVLAPADLAPLAWRHEYHIVTAHR